MPSCSLLLIILLLSSLMGALANSCINLTCPDDDSSGSGSELNSHSEIYDIKISNNTAGQVTVTLSHKTCSLNFYDPGPQWYRIEAVSEYTGAPVGNFLTPKIPDAFKCTGYITAVGFKPCEANILDLPARHIWTRSPETRGKVCFRVNIMPPGRNSNCHTFSKCTTDLGSIPTEPTTVVTPVVRTSTVQLYSVTPSPSRREKCLEKWHCRNARPRVICCSDGNSYPSRCHMRRQECLYNVDIDVLHRGECATTPPPTTPPPPPPPKYCIKNRPIDIFGEWKTQCKCDGNYKRRQCKLNYSGELECWCSSKDGYRTSVAKIVDCHSNLDPFDLDC